MKDTYDQAETRIRDAAIAHVLMLRNQHGVLDWKQISAGFEFQGRKVFLANKARGIFKPEQLADAALSIKTTIPRAGRIARYDDQIASNEPYFAYKYQGDSASSNSPDNVYLRNCLIRGLPVIYFYGVSESVYDPIICIVARDIPSKGVFHVEPAEFGEAWPLRHSMVADAPMQTSFEREYAVTMTKRRLHQDKFRELILHAYRERCAVCSLPGRLLLDAAHLVPDADSRGEASAANGLCLCKLHHAAFDSHMFGISPAKIIHVKDNIMDTRDGELFEVGLRSIQGRYLAEPRSKSFELSKELVSERWENYLRA